MVAGRLLLQWVCVVVIAFVCSSPAFAADDITKGEFKGSRPGVQEKEKGTKSPTGKRYPFYGTLDSVDPTAKTLTLAGKKKNRVFQVRPDTKITRNGKPATLKDGLAGERVTGHAIKSPEGDEQAWSISFGGSAKASTEPKEKK